MGDYANLGLIHADFTVIDYKVSYMKNHKWSHWSVILVDIIDRVDQVTNCKFIAKSSTPIIFETNIYLEQVATSSSD